MRIIAALIFAVLATAVTFSGPYFAGVPIDYQAGVAGDELTLAKRFVQDLRSGNFSDARSLIDPAYRPKDDILQKLARLFPPRRENGFRVTAWHKFSTNGTERTQIEMFYEFGKDGAVRTEFTTFRDGQGLRLYGAHIESFDMSTLRYNDFKLPRSWADFRWFYLALAAAFCMLSYMTFVLCLFSPIVRWRYRWLWALATLSGAPQFNLDWSTLAMTTKFLTVHFPVAALGTYMAYGSWVLSLWVPVGALIYWARRAQWRAEDTGGSDIRAS